MRSNNQRDAAHQADPDQPTAARRPETEPVELEEGHAAGQDHDARKGDGRKIANDGIQERNDQQHGIDPTGIKSSPPSCGRSSPAPDSSVPHSSMWWFLGDL